jgi:hypothetical protein
MRGPGKSQGYVRTIWLLLCREGGTWAPEEITAYVPATRDTIARCMHNMTTRQGQLKRYKIQGRAHFGVTADCKIPDGITVRDLASAGVVATQ